MEERQAAKSSGPTAVWLFHQEDRKIHGIYLRVGRHKPLLTEHEYSFWIWSLFCNYFFMEHKYQKMNVWLAQCMLCPVIWPIATYHIMNVTLLVKHCSNSVLDEGCSHSRDLDREHAIVWGSTKSSPLQRIWQENIKLSGLMFCLVTHNSWARLQGGWMNGWMDCPLVEAEVLLGCRAWHQVFTGLVKVQD